jgi:hypothetical protein
MLRELMTTAAQEPEISETVTGPDTIEAIRTVARATSE